MIRYKVNISRRVVEHSTVLVEVDGNTDAGKQWLDPDSRYDAAQQWIANEVQSDDDVAPVWARAAEWDIESFTRVE